MATLITIKRSLRNFPPKNNSANELAPISRRRKQNWWQTDWKAITHSENADVGKPRDMVDENSAFAGTQMCIFEPVETGAVMIPNSVCNSFKICLGLLRRRRLQINKNRKTANISCRVACVWNFSNRNLFLLLAEKIYCCMLDYAYEFLTFPTLIYF